MIRIDNVNYYDVQDLQQVLKVNERTAYNIFKKYVPEAGIKKFNNDPMHKRSKNYIEETYFTAAINFYMLDKTGKPKAEEKLQTAKDEIKHLQNVLKNVLSRCVIFYGNLDDPTLPAPIPEQKLKGYDLNTGKEISREEKGYPFDFHIMNKELFEKWKKEYFEKQNTEKN